MNPNDTPASRPPRAPEPPSALVPPQATNADDYYRPDVKLAAAEEDVNLTDDGINLAAKDPGFPPPAGSDAQAAATHIQSAWRGHALREEVGKLGSTI
ncbi:hypothetical protein HDV00_007209 [Rhizophlyctis rosea]|nr:hypothetical protein HDV00_007209 [Rhizophlyctis rosea]